MQTPVAIVAALSLGLVFFAARGFVLYAMQTLPGPGLRPLRDRLTAWSIARYRALDRERHVGLWAITATRWHERDFDRPKYTTPWQERPGRKEALEASGRAREVLEGLAVDDLPNAAARRRIVDGLRLLHGRAVDAYDERDCRDEIEAWRRVCQAKPAVGQLQVAVEMARREFQQVHVRLERLPDTEWLQPTALGNRRAALDQYARARYGINTSVLWVRLLGVLSDRDRAEAADARLSVETLANIGFAMILLAAGVLVSWGWALVCELVASFPPLAWPGLPVVRPALFFVVALLLAAFAYASSVFAFNGYAERVKRLIDLHRREVIEGLGLKLPATVAEERALFTALERFFLKAMPLEPSLALRHAKEGDGEGPATAVEVDARVQLGLGSHRR